MYFVSLVLALLVLAAATMLLTSPGWVIGVVQGGRGAGQERAIFSGSRRARVLRWVVLLTAGAVTFGLVGAATGGQTWWQVLLFAVLALGGMVLCQGAAYSIGFAGAVERRSRRWAEGLRAADGDDFPG